MISLIPDKELAAKFNGKYAYMYAMYPNSSFWKKSADDTARYFEALDELNSYLPGEPALLYIHYPFCEKICFFCSCNKTAAKMSEYERRPISTLDSIIQELNVITNYIKQNNINHNIKNIHFGGGSPTFLKEPEFEKLVQNVNKLVPF